MKAGDRVRFESRNGKVIEGELVDTKLFSYGFM